MKFNEDQRQHSASALHPNAVGEAAFIPRFEENSLLCLKFKPKVDPPRRAKG